MTRHLLCLLVAMAFMSIGSCAQAPQRQTYVLAVSASAARFDEDDALSVGGGVNGGVVLVRLDGEPIDVLDQGGSVYRLNHWPSGVKRKISVSGTASVPLYLKVAILDNDAVHVLGRAIHPAGKQNPTEISFEARSNWTPPEFDDIPQTERAHEEAKEACAKMLGKLIDMLRAKEGERAAQLLNRAKTEWWRAAYGTPQSEVSQETATAARAYSNHELRLQIPEGHLHFSVGKSVVLVWRQLGNAVVPLFELQGGSLPLVCYRLRLVRINDEWVVWD